MMDPHKINLTAADIAAILNACAASRASSLKFGPLEVSFHPPIPTTGWETWSEPRASPIDPAAPHPGNEIPDAESQTEQEAEALELAEMRLRQEQLDEMPLSDPAGFEELIAQGELTDESGRS